MKRQLLILFMIFYVGTAKAQIKGVVYMKATKEALPGATIHVVGTDKYSISNEIGEFEVATENGNHTLRVSFIGFEKQEISVKVPQEGIIEFFLQESGFDLQEAEVFSTGYQEIPKERATGSFERLGQEMIDRPVAPDILSRLQDVTPGLIFNRNGPANDRLSIRGRGTLFSNTSPLIVVDNFPYDGDIENINPNDVASITILRDAAAASIWGAQAGNGVIVITTKTGSAKEKLRVSINSNIRVGEREDLFYAPIMTVDEFINVEQMLFGRGFYNTAEISFLNPPLTPVVEALIANRDGFINDQELNTRLNLYRGIDTRTSFLDEFYRKSIDQQHSVAISGGSEIQTYRLSIGYDKNLGTIRGRDRDRLTISGNQSWNLLKNRLQISSGIYLAKSRTDNQGLSYNNLRMDTNTPLYPYARFRKEDGSPAPINKDFSNNLIEQASQDGLLDWRYFPLEEAFIGENYTIANDLRLNLNLSYKIINGLDAEVQYQYWNLNSNSRNHRPVESHFARSLINDFTQLSNNGGLIRNIPLGGILTNGKTLTSSNHIRSQLRYLKSFGKSDLSLLAGGEIKSLTNNSFSNRYYGYVERIAGFSPVDYINLFPTYSSMGIMTRNIPNADFIRGLNDNFISYYSNGSYTFDKKYTLSASARRDLSNLFGVEANQRGVPLYSLGGSWLLSEESFYKNISSWVPFLKFRATYGYNGNINKEISALTTARQSGTSTFSRLLVRSIVNPPNPDLRWERIRIINLATEFATKNDRLSGYFEFYFKDGLDLIGATPFPSFSGISSFIGNTASTSAQGFDFSLTSRLIDKQFKWTLHNFHSHINEKVNDYEVVGTAINYLQRGTGVGSLLPIPLTGRPLYAIYSFPYMGLDPNSGAPIGILDGEPSMNYNTIVSTTTPEELIFHGAARPTHFGSFRNELSYKGFNLSMNITYRLGYYYRRNSIRYSTVLNAQGGHGDFSKRWQQPGDELITQVPSMPDIINTNRDNLYLYSPVLVERGDHFRLQDIRLSYSFNHAQNSHPIFRNLEIYGYANNLGILWKATDDPLDPDFQTLRALTSFAVGLRLDF
ncbi:SusC/RagA family TonB-linked outer membrane protein [Mongoliitalea daihaiensis]|uniref:SusC/RagA family TonB-linked outer membrane protein n=1 Tax=Mongoliitalea daihaiensis TaxID=2782006 RepID=UPI001F422C87|nr:SusC/RagA family TonB-linked outer membrane protein [Mongoliitalea daihaiensis]UJP65820.1 SusC/RagA family TonB-linked outer membrane protein [Mongoliitalea daihaiensis]